MQRRLPEPARPDAADLSSVRAEIDRRLDSAGRGELVAVLVCGLDRLEAVTAALGHEASAQAEAVVAERLARVVRDCDTLVRLADGALVIVTSGLPAFRDLDLLAARILSPLQEAIPLAAGRSAVVTCSVGIAAVPGGQRPPVDAAELLRRAAVASQRARTDGGNGFVVADEDLWIAPPLRLEREEELRAALRDDCLVVHYQPIVDAVTGAVDRVEALVRWEQSDRRIVLPSEFLPLAAESDLILDIGEWVLSEACRQGSVWSQRYGRSIAVSVNVAERQLAAPGLVEAVTRALAASALPADRLELEVGADAVLALPERAATVLRRLDLLGVRVAIDHAGTSRASLGRLRELAMASTLKLDRSHVAGLVGDGDRSADRAVVAAVVALADDIGLSVVAEGVETAEQAATLREAGVDHLQGFLFQRPGPASAIEAALEDGFAIGSPAARQPVSAPPALPS